MTTTAIPHLNGSASEPFIHKINDEWRHNARCAGSDPEVFFPEGHQSADAAKRICAACPMRERCLEYALANGEDIGVWGGLSASERKRLSPDSVRNHAAATRQQRDRLIMRLYVNGVNGADIARATDLNERTVYRVIGRESSAHADQVVQQKA